jgi:predicted nucleic acid-binding protein
VSLFVDTSVWSEAFRRDAESNAPQVTELRRCLEAGALVVTTGIVIQELLQGFNGPKDRQRLIERLSSLPLVSPDRKDHIEAAELRNVCRTKGVTAHTIDVLIVQLCLRNKLTLLTTDKDFSHIAKHCDLKIWK